MSIWRCSGGCGRSTPPGSACSSCTVFRQRFMGGWDPFASFGRSEAVENENGAQILVQGEGGEVA